MASACGNGSRTAQSTTVRTRLVTQPSTTSSAGIVRHRRSTPVRRSGATFLPTGTATCGCLGSHMRFHSQCAAALMSTTVPVSACAASRAGWSVGSA